MRGGAPLRCVVNGAAGRELAFRDAAPPHGERIAVIGAGPAGLTYASLVAPSNAVTVFERDAAPGGAFRLAGKAPLFQEVAANEASFAAYIAELVRACAQRGVIFRYSIDVTRSPDSLGGFDRIVIATGARYRFGIGRLVTALLERGAGRWPGFRRLFSAPWFREWFYFRARRGTADAVRPVLRPGQAVLAIGDAARPGKSKEAIASAFEAALLAR
jgi:threonine dehydrogenase-like Zn-dependent dehydrogenase